MNTPLRIALFAAAGWLAGKMVALTLPDAGAQSSRKAKAETSAGSAQAGTGSARASRSAGGAATLAAAPERMETAEGALAAELQFAAAGAEEFPALLEIVARVKNARLRRQMAGVLFEAWAARDVSAALAAVSRFPALSMTALHGTLTAWAEHDPQGLIQWLRSDRVHGWARMQAQRSALSCLMEQAPEQALTDLKDTPLDPAAVKSGFAAWCARDAAAVDRWYAAADPDTRRQFFEPWVMARAAASPAAAWAMALRDAPDAETRTKSLESIFHQWRDDRDGGAAQALAALPAESWHPRLAAAAGRFYTARADAVTQLAAVMPPEMQESFRAAAIGSALDAQPDPAAAAAHFRHLPADSDERLDCADRIAKAWAAAGDFESAAAWIESLPRGDAARDFATAALAAGLHATDPQAAQTWARQIESSGIRDSVLKKLTP